MIFLISNYINSSLSAFVSFYVGSFQLTGGTSPSPNPRIDSSALPVVALPYPTYINASGALRSCFPINKRGC